ncbi:hypothetical protein QN224_14305 [Sinorhizobium sp. 8-89]|uniref:hypothetical protein n=1 Tax=Sinorhizobium sp. 7-81 TaxID=3049087 RepID=UPI0024C22A2C|nr:hypothetical protein [Sinorhizobium sp. 7-81]MDK1386579.1 hypothetical protein [Sinorhizobium sp. 7-81]
MNSPYQLLSTAILDLESNPEVQAVLAFAKEVVDRFYGDLRNAASNGEKYKFGFLLMSFDKVTFGDPPLASEEHCAATSTGKVGRFMCFPDDVTAKEVLRVFTAEQMDIQTFLFMTLVSLRQIEVEGPSHMANFLLEDSYNRLKGFLARGLHARQAA